MSRSRVIWALTFFVIASGLVSAAAHAGPRPNAIASYCSPSGDTCFGVMNRSGAVYLELTTFARYFGRYRLCVLPPGGAAGSLRCGSYPVLRRGSVWGSSVKFSRLSRNVGPGTYRVTWKLGARRLGPTLRFKLPLAG